LCVCKCVLFVFPMYFYLVTFKKKGDQVNVLITLNFIVWQHVEGDYIIVVR
jgi:hypothetical protein